MFSKSALSIIPLLKHLNGFSLLLEHRPKSLHVLPIAYTPWLGPCWCHHPCISCHVPLHFVCAGLFCLSFTCTVPSAWNTLPTFLPTSYLVDSHSSFIFQYKQYFPDTPSHLYPIKTGPSPFFPICVVCHSSLAFFFRVPCSLSFCWWVIWLFLWPDHKVLSVLLFFHHYSYPRHSILFSGGRYGGCSLVHF